MADASLSFHAIIEPAAGARLRQRIFGQKSFILGGGLLLVIIIIAVLAPLLATHDPYGQDLAHRMVPPFWYGKGSIDHILGTDNLGRDYFSRLLYGARISLLIGLSVMVISGIIGTALGLVAGDFGG
jgi:peptide/nickel transport system permease protein